MNALIDHIPVAAQDFWSSIFWPRYHPDARPRGRPAPIAPGSLVTVALDVAGLQTVQGFLVSSERLGLGVIEALGAGGQVRVRWSKAGVETWAEREDLCPLEPGWSLVTIMRCDGRGHRTLLRHATAQLQHHWTIELLPDNVVRAVRSDDSAWTFTINPVTEEVRASWLYPYDDDDAEALTVAELAGS